VKDTECTERTESAERRALLRTLECLTTTAIPAPPDGRVIVAEALDMLNAEDLKDLTWAIHDSYDWCESVVKWARRDIARIVLDAVEEYAKKTLIYKRTLEDEIQGGRHAE